MIGITKYIHVHLQSNVKFSPPPLIIPKTENKSKSKCKGSEMGLQIGRYTDLLFRKIIDNKTKLDLTNFKHRRCRFIFDVLNQHKITVSKTQVRVKNDELQTQTLLDGLGTTQHGNPCVIELKTTQYTLLQHESRYNSRCRIKPLLTNGLPNTEFILHGLQAAFGAISLKKEFPMCQKQIKAVVIVAASDGAKAYWVDDRFMQTSVFSGSSKVQLPQAITSSSCVHAKTKFHEWPSFKTIDSLKTCLYNRGYTTSEPNTFPTLHCSGIAYGGNKSAPTCIALIGIINSLTNKRLDTSKMAIYKRMLRADLVKIYKKYKSRVSVHTYLVYPNIITSSFDFISATRPMIKSK